MLSFRQIDNFNNTTSSYNPSIPMERTLLSPQGNLLIRYDRADFRLYDLIEKIQIPISINTNILKAVFSLDQKQIIFTNIIGISSYSLVEKSISLIIKEDAMNNITDFQINQDYTELFYLNRSLLTSLNLKTLKPAKNGTKTNNCNGVKMTYDINSQTIITSTLVSSQSVCFICKWNITDNNFIFVQSNNISYCVINDIYILGKQIAITKKSFNINLMNTIILDFNTLNEVTRTTQSKSYGNAGFIVPYHNYYLQYFSISNLIYVYKDNFNSAPFTISTQFIMSLQYNRFKDTFYIVSKDPSSNMATIRTLVATFNCALANNTIFNTSTPYDIDCICDKGMIFNKQSFSCQNVSCETEGKSCKCPQKYAYNSFNLKCQLECNYTLNAYNVEAYGSPARCPCQSPFVWNQTSNDCSSINCALVNHSSSAKISSSCQCLSQFVWNNSFQACIEKSQDSFVDPIIIIDFENETKSNVTNNMTSNMTNNMTSNMTNNMTSNMTNNMTSNMISNRSITNNTILPTQSQGTTGSPAGLIIGLMILLLLLLGGAVYYYYKRCKALSQRNVQNHERQSEPGPTQRQLSSKQKIMRTPNIESNEELKPEPPRSYQTNSSPKKSDDKDLHLEENLENFSIQDIQDDEDIEKDPYFSEIQSNIENPLH